MPSSIVDNFLASSRPEAVPQAAPQSIKGVLDAIVALRDQQVRIMERLDDLSLGIRGQTLGGDKDCLLVASPT